MKISEKMIIKLQEVEEIILKWDKQKISVFEIGFGERKEE